jgi:hypothetical protein
LEGHNKQFEDKFVQRHKRGQNCQQQQLPHTMDDKNYREDIFRRKRSHIEDDDDDDDNDHDDDDDEDDNYNDNEDNEDDEDDEADDHDANVATNDSDYDKVEFVGKSTNDRPPGTRDSLGFTNNINAPIDASRRGRNPQGRQQNKREKNGGGRGGDRTSSMSRGGAILPPPGKKWGGGRGGDQTSSMSRGGAILPPPARCRAGAGA